MEQIHTSTFNTLKGMCFTNYRNDVYKATTQDKFEGVRNHTTLGLTDSGSWANFKEGPRA